MVEKLKEESKVLMKTFVGSITPSRPKEGEKKKPYSRPENSTSGGPHTKNCL